MSHPGLNWEVLLALPGFALLAINAGWVVLLFGITSTRFRDIPQVVSSLINLLFFMTPIVWTTDILKDKFGDTADWRDWVAELNPLYHFIQVVRAPLIGNAVSWTTTPSSEASPSSAGHLLSWSCATTVPASRIGCDNS